MTFDLRIATPSDAAEFLRIYTPSVVDSAVSFEDQPPTADEMAQRIEKLLRTHPWICCAAPAGPRGAIAGYAYACPHRERAAYRWAVEVSVYVDAEHRGRGIGHRLYFALLRILAAQRFTVAYAGITLPNDASVRLHESLDFNLVGVYERVGWKAGAWRDVGWWACHIFEDLASLQRRGSPPPEPIPFPEVRARREVRNALMEILE